MRKTTPRSEWEDIQGFDRTKGEYTRLDGEAWLAAHRIRAEGERRGKRNQPGSKETLPDEMYLKIESWVRKRALDCKEEVGKYIVEELANLHDSGSFWEKQNPEIDLEALVTQRCQDLHAKADQSVSDLDKQRAEFEEAARDLKNFRQRHRLSRVAHYPSNQVSHWLWVPVAGIVGEFRERQPFGKRLARRGDRRVDGRFGAYLREHPFGDRRRTNLALYSLRLGGCKAFREL